ncbi:inhibitor of vertebrate lysozyme family protein [Pseudomonas aegrilactucae]|uniref:Inhibitor of vertebrate lysozyme family protein n=1 Tax=Pseudomonas aegrilactucae TaxID=2854028 RepID=A0A9Q2XRA4_9PSED|nr:inhibitor of vertebrate lysozyme family protein [Pseudomonas aegrilactucae]MBV6290291.1 inhibitor of vertebrate lysozyme family protein [Pseudomonas aegrilactucae]
MNRTLRNALAGALMVGACTAAMAANDGQVRTSQLLGSDPEYRETWQDVVKNEERLPDWVINLSGASTEQMTALQEDGDKYLVGPLCETQQSCSSARLIVAFSWDKDDAYGLLVTVPAGLPADRSPSRHTDRRWLGEPDKGMQQMLEEQLKKDPNYY